METEAIAELPDDGLAKVLGVLPPRSLAVARCVCKAWRDVIEARALLLPHILPQSVRGVFINYIDHDRPHLFARPALSSTFPRIDGLLSFLPNDPKHDWWTVLDHCNGLVLCNIKWESRFLVCNPATQRWTLLPTTVRNTKVRSCAYIAFDPNVSPQYEVFLLPDVPEKPEPPPAAPVYRKVHQKPAQSPIDGPFCLESLFSFHEGGALSIDEDQTDKGQYHDDDPSINEDQTDKGQYHGDDPSIDEDQTDMGQYLDDDPSSDEDQTDKGQYNNDDDPSIDIDQTEKGQYHDDDPCRLMEWPPSSWSLKVFSSSTGLWEDKHFVREGQPAGTVEDVRLDPPEPTWQGPRRRYAVYQNGGLYVHCRGSFMARFSLSTGKYQVIKMPTEAKSVKSYLGASKNAVYFGIVSDDRRQLRVWMLSESCGHMEWLLKHEADIGLYADHIASLPYNNGRQPDGSWMVEEDNNYMSDSDSNAETQFKESIEWDSDKDDIFTVEARDEYRSTGGFDILGFHPYKEVVFLARWFGVASYHFTGPKIQYLGNSRPRCYYHNYTNGIYESFMYTPCIIGDLLHGQDDKVEI